MALPDRITVKLSSEAGGTVVITPVVSQELPVSELLERMLWAFGKDADRIQDLLRRGSLVSGASRFRWSPVEASHDEIRRMLGQFPDPEPWRQFEPAKCVRACVRDALRQLEITREAASEKRLFKRQTFWGILMATVPSPAYADYSYRDRADRFTATLDSEQARALREAAPLLKYTRLEESIATMRLHTLDLFTVR